MSNFEQLILNKLESIERRLNELYVPVLVEKNRQYITAPREVRAASDRELLKRKRAEMKTGRAS
jgi:hypothetical protein